MASAIADRVYARATTALGSLPVAERTDTYVVSFFVHDHEDDPPATGADDRDEHRTSGGWGDRRCE
jgi:hypothetical protein